MPPPGPRLSAEERALWARVAATVTPLSGRADMPPPVPVDLPQTNVSDAQRHPRPTAQPAPVRRAAAPHASSLDTLDGGWDKRLRQGTVSPERTIDLHGHTLVSAHAALEQSLARAVADDIRVLLVVTGKPPKPDAKGRGLIRASIGDWLGGSGYRDRIAAVRHAHPRHGGSGALYLILRRKRGG